MTVLPFNQPRTQVRVKVLYAPWEGSGQVPADEAGTNFSLSYEINGHKVETDMVELKLSWFWEIILRVPDKDYLGPCPDGWDKVAWERITESNHELFTEQYQAVRNEFTEEDWAEETTDDVLVLPVSHLELVERQLPEWHAATQH